MMILRLAFVAIFIFLSACSGVNRTAEYIPENPVLNNAVVGKPYLTKVTILGGGVIGGRGAKQKIGFVIPDNAGIFLRNCQLPDEAIKDMSPKDSNDYNCIEIYGTPVKPGVIQINIGGSMFGSMLRSANTFSKDYTLNVVKQ